jgi:hypothetical protein
MRRSRALIALTLLGWSTSTCASPPPPAPSAAPAAPPIAATDPSGDWSIRWDRGFTGWKPAIFEGRLSLRRDGAKWDGELGFKQSSVKPVFDSLRLDGDRIDVLFRVPGAGGDATPDPMELRGWIREGRLVGEIRWGQTIPWTPAGGRRVESASSVPSEPPSGESGWIVSGGARDSYAVRRDTQGGHTAWLLEPTRDTAGGYGTWMRHVDAGDYKGKRVRITASVKTQGATQRVDFWARAQGERSPSDGQGLGGDWRALPADSGWVQEVIVLDVPAETAFLEYGVGVAGPGKVWLESAKVEAVGADVAATGQKPGPVPGWTLEGDDVPEYSIALDTAVKHGGGHASGALRSVVPQPKGFGTLDQGFGARPYAGKRLRVRAFIKADKVTGWAGLWMRVDGERTGLAFDNMEKRPIKGTRDWARYDVVLDVAADSTAIAFGVLLYGAGQVWMDDVAFDVVDASVPTTTPASAPAENLNFEQ